jgi:hypothetical protein
LNEVAGVRGCHHVDIQVHLDFLAVIVGQALDVPGRTEAPASSLPKNANRTEFWTEGSGPSRVAIPSRLATPDPLSTMPGPSEL